MLKIVGHNRNETNTEGHRRIPIVVDHPIEILDGQRLHVRNGFRMDGVVVVAQQISTARDRCDIVGRLSVADRTVVERQREPVAPPIGGPYLLGTGHSSYMVVLHARQMPDQPGDRVGLGVGTERQSMLRDVVEGVVHDTLDAFESVHQYFGVIHEHPFVGTSHAYPTMNSVAGISVTRAPVAPSMKAIRYTRTGDSSVLTLEDRDIPEPGPGEVRVKVAVSGVNPTDWKNRSGATGELAFDEVSPNQDGAGTIDATGPGVEGLANGDRVWLYLSQYQRPSGTAQEYTVVSAEHVVRLPENVSFDVGASLGVPAMTAHRALTVSEDGPTRLHPSALDGKTVLVAGGAGAVGHAAIQLARWAGATVVTTVSGPEKAALATAAGAHHVVNYKTGDAASEIRAIAPNGVDLIVEVAPAQNAKLNAAVAANRASIAIYANNGGDSFTLDIRPNMVTNARYQFVLLYTVGDDALKAAEEDVTNAAAAGVLEVGEDAGLPLHRFSLADTAAAHDAVESGTVGKVLIDL